MNRPLILIAALILMCLAPIPGRAQDPQATEIYPLQIGTEWVFTAGEREIVERVVAHDVIGGEECARVETRYNGKLIAHEHLAVRADGIYRLAVAGEQVTPPLCFLKHPGRSGETWEVRSKVQGKEIAVRMLRGEERIRLPMGEFVAITVQGKNVQPDGQQVQFTYYFVPGLGKVQQRVSAGGRDMALTLKEFRPAARTAQR